MTYFIKLCLLCVTLSYDVSTAFPQNWPSTSDTKSKFDWKKNGGNKNVDWSGSSDDDLEKLGSEVLKKNEVNFLFKSQKIVSPLYSIRFESF